MIRVGDYKLDSSNFISGDGFTGFMGSAGQVGVDGDYNSLRQDLWIATDGAYKQALDNLAHKQGFLRSLSKPPEIADFSEEKPLVKLIRAFCPIGRTEIGNRKRSRSAQFCAQYPELYSNRITLHADLRNVLRDEYGRHASSHQPLACGD